MGIGYTCARLSILWKMSAIRTNKLGMKNKWLDSCEEAGAMQKGEDVGEGSARAAMWLSGI